MFVPPEPLETSPLLGPKKGRKVWAWAEWWDAWPLPTYFLWIWGSALALAGFCFLVCCSASRHHNDIVTTPSLRAEELNRFLSDWKIDTQAFQSALASTTTSESDGQDEAADLWQRFGEPGSSYMERNAIMAKAIGGLGAQRVLEIAPVTPGSYDSAFFASEALRDRNVRRSIRHWVVMSSSKRGLEYSQVALSSDISMADPRISVDTLVSSVNPKSLALPYSRLAPSEAHRVALEVMPALEPAQLSRVANLSRFDCLVLFEPSRDLLRAMPGKTNVVMVVESGNLESYSRVMRLGRTERVGSQHIVVGKTL